LATCHACFWHLLIGCGIATRSMRGFCSEVATCFMKPIILPREASYCAPSSIAWRETGDSTPYFAWSQTGRRCANVLPANWALPTVRSKVAPQLLPITPFLRGQTFQLETIETMGAALENACKSLKPVDRSDSLNEVIAVKVIVLAASGKHDAKRFFRPHEEYRRCASGRTRRTVKLACLKPPPRRPGAS
jgi:hypothetical protein